MTSIVKELFASPSGMIEIEANDEYITSLKFTNDQDFEDEINNSSEVVNHCIAELREYFAVSRKEFTISFQLTGTDFEKQVWEELVRIPYGKTISYEELALRLGDIKKIRAVAQANRKNPIAIIVPCHRVIGKDGSLVGYAGGLKQKEWLLSHEGAISKQFSIF